MDDLTQIKGIGKATTRRLVAAGIDSFAALAASTPEQLAAIDKLGGSPADWLEWVGQAKALVSGPVDLGQATAQQLGDHAARIDAARAKVIAAGEAAAAAAATGSADAIEQARLATLTATAELDGLIGPGDTEIPAGSHISGEGQSDAAAPPAFIGVDRGHEIQPHTPQSDDDQEGGAGNPADPAAEDVVQAEIASVIAAVRKMAESDPEWAIAHLEQQIAEAQHMAHAVQRIVLALQNELVLQARTETVWPLTSIRFDGVEQPIGEPLKVDLKTFLALTGSGAAADHAPEFEA